MSAPFVAGATCELLEDGDYSRALRQSVQSAARRCLCSLFIIDLKARCSGQCVADVVDDLEDAVWRGVDVRVLIGGSRSLIVFPEGTRSTDGVVGRFKGGMFLLAIEAGLPVVPVSIAGSRFVMLKGRLMTCPGDVTITVHDPISTEGVTREQAREFAERVRAIVRTAVDEDEDDAASRSKKPPHTGV